MREVLVALPDGHVRMVIRGVPVEEDLHQNSELPNAVPNVGGALALCALGRRVAQVLELVFVIQGTGDPSPPVPSPPFPLSPSLPFFNKWTIALPLAPSPLDETNNSFCSQNTPSCRTALTALASVGWRPRYFSLTCAQYCEPLT